MTHIDVPYTYWFPQCG